MTVYGTTVKPKPYFQTGNHKYKIQHSDIGFTFDSTDPKALRAESCEIPKHSIKGGH